MDEERPCGGLPQDRVRHCLLVGSQQAPFPLLPENLQDMLPRLVRLQSGSACVIHGEMQGDESIVGGHSSMSHSSVRPESSFRSVAIYRGHSKPDLSLMSDDDFSLHSHQAFVGDTLGSLFCVFLLFHYK